MHIKLERKHWPIVAILTAILVITAATILTPRIFAPHAAVTYHVDNEAAPNGDGSLDSPWDNIAGHVDDLAAGDIMNIHPGTYHESTTIRLTNNGTENAPITLRAYAADDQPIIHAPGDIIGITGNWWIIDNLILDRRGVGGFAINISGDHNAVQRCEVKNGTYAGIHLRGADDNLIQNNIIHDFIGPQEPHRDSQCIVLGDRSHNNVFRGNSIYDCGDGILFYIPTSANPGDYDTSGNVIEHNHIWNTPDNAQKCENAIDIKMGCPIIRGNVIHGFRRGGGDAGSALLIHGQLIAETIIEDNVIYDSSSAIRCHNDNPNGSLITIRRNLIHDCVLDHTTWLHVLLQLTTHDYNVYNNTFVNCPDHYIAVQNANNVYIRNNLSFNTHDPQVWAPTANLDTDYNGWFHVPPSAQFRGPHDTTGDDPLLTADYHLTENSPARGAGENGADLGAFPYAPTQPTPTPTADSPIPTPTTDSPIATPTTASSPTPSATPTAIASPTPTVSPTPSLTPSPTPTSTREWWENCPPGPTCSTPLPHQPTLTPRPTLTPVPIPTCRPTITCPPTPSPYPTATLYPTHTPYPPQPPSAQAGMEK